MISGQSLIKGNCHNSRPSNDIDLKLGPVTRLDRRNKRTSGKFDYEVMSENCDIIVIFPIYGQFGAIWKPDSGRIVCKMNILINSNLLSWKRQTELKRLQHSSYTIDLSKDTILTNKPKYVRILTYQIWSF